jgi:phosphate transport system substrate-binding protein
MNGRTKNVCTVGGNVTVLLMALTVGILNSGCSSSSGTSGGGGGGAASNGAALSGKITIDGSSTVYPITQAVAEEFMELHPKVKVEVGVAGTGGGFKRFVEGKTDINDSSRPISEKEIEHCRENNIEYLEIKVAIDGLTVAVNPNNDWCDCLTVEQLRALWQPGSQVTKWNQLDPKWPDAEIRLYGADSDSGTFDYFTEVINGKAKASRTDYTASANDNTLVNGVSGDRNALGYFGYSYYVENKDKLKAIGIVPPGETAPEKCVKPTMETIESGAYAPLSRPLFLHVNRQALAWPEVASFLKYYLNEGQDLVSEVKYIRLNPGILESVQTELNLALEANK